MCLSDIRCFIYMNLHLEYPGITLLNSVTSIVITADNQRYSIYQNVHINKTKNIILTHII
jgi:hypothetical protein